jgi:hypothetical protein
MRVLAAAAAAVLLLVVPLVLGQQTGWPAWTYCSLAAGAAIAVLFVRIERQVARRGGDPLLNLGVLRSPGLPSGLTTLVLTQVGYGGLLFTFTLYLQAGLGESALRAALSYLPMSVMFGLAAYCWRRLPAVLHRDLPAAGLALSGIGYLALAVAVRHGQQAPLSAYLAQTAIGTGLGLSVGPLLTQSLARVELARIADASGLLTTSVQLGQLTGIAALGSVYLALRNSVHATTAATHAAMTTTSYWLAALSLAGLVVAVATRRSIQAPLSPKAPRYAGGSGAGPNRVASSAAESGSASMTTSSPGSSMVSRSAVTRCPSRTMAQTQATRPRASCPIRVPAAAEPSATRKLCRPSGSELNRTPRLHGSGSTVCIGTFSRAATNGTSPPCTTTENATTTKMTSYAR